MNKDKFLKEFEKFRGMFCEEVIAGSGSWIAGKYEEETFLSLSLSTWGDYGGSTVERSNCRVLEDMFQYTNWTTVRHYGYNGHAWGIIPERFPNRSQMYDELLELLEGLEQYPLIEDDDHSELELEILEEQANDILQDTAHALEKAGYPVTALLVREDNVEVLWKAISELGIYPQYETAVSAWIDTDCNMWLGFFNSYYADDIQPRVAVEVSKASKALLFLQELLPNDEALEHIIEDFDNFRRELENDDDTTVLLDRWNNGLPKCGKSKWGI